MTDLTPYITLKEIVSYTVDEVDKSIGDFDKCWLLGLRAVGLLNRDVAGQTMTVRLPVESNMTVPLPAGCQTWTKIGLLDDKGQVNTLRVNNALTTFRDNNPNRLEDLTPNINNSIGSLALVPYYSNFYYGSAPYTLYGVGNGVITYGDCKVDELNRVIILGLDFKYDSIILEYVVNPEKETDYRVPAYLQEPIIAFIKWKLKLGTREEYYGEVTKARRSMPKKKVILQTLNQVIRESNGFKLRS